MVLIQTYFFDSYAFFEIIEGNVSYLPYAENARIITNRLNLMEVHYGRLLAKGKEEADKYYDYLLQFTVPLTDDIIKQANEFRATFKKRKLSYIDCVGYILAKSLGVKFLTGDKQFEDLDNVEFVK